MKKENQKIIYVLKKTAIILLSFYLGLITGKLIFSFIRLIIAIIN